MIPFNVVKIVPYAIGAVAGALIAAAPSYLVGKNTGRAEIELRAAQNALERMAELEKNNANFQKLSSRDRCLLFMRDSGLSADNCD